LKPLQQLLQLLMVLLRLLHVTMRRDALQVAM
jgi:hypothetical protein